MFYGFYDMNCNAPVHLSLFHRVLAMGENSYVLVS